MLVQLLLLLLLCPTWALQSCSNKRRIKSGYLRDINLRKSSAHNILSKSSGLRLKPSVNDDSLPKPVRDYSSLGPFENVAKFVDRTTNNFFLYYADLSPYDEKHWIGFAFLLTNFIYLYAGYLFFVANQNLVGLIVDIAGLCSINYHYNQLRFKPGNLSNEKIVQFSLFVDYCAAITAIITSFYTLEQYSVSSNSIPWEVVEFTLVGFFSLVLSWKWEFGLPYIFFHGLWHIFTSLGAVKMAELLS